MPQRFRFLAALRAACKAATLRGVIGENDPLWLSEQPTGTHHSGGMGSPTLPGWATTNSTPSRYVELQNASQAAQAVKFAAEHNLQITVKNTGHDWFGRSISPGALLLWTHRMTSTQWHESFVPTGCVSHAPAAAVTLGAGVQFWQIAEEMAQNKRLVVSGNCLTVGHVGFSLGGGYGDYSRMYGSGATNMLEAEVVLAAEVLPEAGVRPGARPLVHRHRRGLQQGARFGGGCVRGFGGQDL